MKTIASSKAILFLPVLLAGAFLTACGDDDSSGQTSTSGLHLNEVLAANSMTCADEAGQYDDWIELYNSSDKDIDLQGLSISDDPDVPKKRVFGAGLKVPAGGYLLLWADDDTTQGDNHLPFKLSATGEQILLYNANGDLLDQTKWTNAVTDVSFARLPDGTGTFVSCGSPTCGTENGSSCSAAPDAGGQ